MSDGSEALDAAFCQRLPRLSLALQGRVQGQALGTRRSATRGPGTEVVDHRPLTRGDSLRLLDWKALARTGKPYVRTFAQDTQAQLGVLVDCSASMGVYGGGKFDQARRLAALLAHAGLQGRDRVVLAASHGAETSFDAGRDGLRQLPSALAFLRNLSAHGGTDLLAAARSLHRSRLPRGLVVLISDLLDHHGFEAATRELQRHGHQVHVLHVVAPEEHEPPLSGASELVDAETQERLRLTFDASAHLAYVAAFQARQRAIAKHCLRRGMGYVEISSSEPFATAVARLRRADILVP